MVWSWSGGEDHIAEAIDELEAEKAPHRVTAIVGASLVEARLRPLVAEYFPRDGATKDELLRPVGTLGNVDMQAKLAYVFGIISKPALHDLVTVAGIRNKFAHNLEIRDFRDPAIIKLCLKLELIHTHIRPAPVGAGSHYSGVHYAEPGGPWLTLTESDVEAKRKDPRTAFLLTVRLLFMALTPMHQPAPRPPLRQPLI